ncbi:MAG: hypothetical protein L6R42_004820 [Xanthoria sp. 1 TBL-2021]|nr:MAG: hypothetical protein L6R42_004820 [Xanthoria sp. 1 TBL-2021]
MAAMSGDLECVEMLIQRQFDVNTTGSYYGNALQAAARVDSTIMVRQLLKAGANVNIIHGAYDTAIRAAVRGDHLPAVENLAEAGADLNLYAHKGEYHKPNSQCILQLAIMNGNKPMVETLLSYGAKINTTGKTYGGGFFLVEASPLHLASSRDHGKIVRTFITHGAEIDKNIENSATPLQIAAAWVHVVSCSN